MARNGRVLSYVLEKRCPQIPSAKTVSIDDMRHEVGLFKKHGPNTSQKYIQKKIYYINILYDICYVMVRYVWYFLPNYHKFLSVGLPSGEGVSGRACMG